MGDDVSMDDLQCRLDKYLSVLKAAEEEQNVSKVRRYKRIIKQYEAALKLCANGKPVPVDELPNPPGFAPLSNGSLVVPDSNRLPATPNASPRSSPRPSPRPSPTPSPRPVRRQDVSPAPPPRSALPVVLSESSNFIGNIMDQPIDDTLNIPETGIPILLNDQLLQSSSVTGTLDTSAIDKELSARLEVYKSVLKNAEEESNSGKVRRYKRIIKQYTDAISLNLKGKPVSLEELPSPPGFPPLVPVKSAPPSPVPERSAHFLQDDEIIGQAEEAGIDPELVSGIPSQVEQPQPLIKPILTRSDRQTATLRERQKEYKDAAIVAKRSGQIQEAKEFLKLCKGFDRLIQASESGLPVDLTTIPVSLKSKTEIDETFHFVTDMDLTEGDSSENFETLEKELTEQIKMCMVTRNNFKTSGDIANANRFEQYALNFKKDLNHVKMCHSNMLPIPKFHYENKSFSIIKSNSDLTDNDLELTIMQGINYNVSNPNEVDTYITYEFPYPSESPPTGRTSVVKNTNYPVYNVKTIFPINKQLRACQRVFKRHGIKLEVWAKGGFLRSDTSLGTVVVKLMPLNTDISIHEAFDLMNGRRPTGGKLEVKVRMREPLFTRKVESVSEKWLIIDYK